MTRKEWEERERQYYEFKRLESEERKQKNAVRAVFGVVHRPTGLRARASRAHAIEIDPPSQRDVWHEYRLEDVNAA